jgi:biotin carboxyl carrier protein
LKLRVEVDNEEYSLDLSLDGETSVYRLRGVNRPSNIASGTASIVETQAGVYSVLLGNRSLEVRVPRLRSTGKMRTGDDPLEVWVERRRYLISQADPRDSAAKHKGAEALGPREIRAQMPGKVINILVAPGERVQTGQGLIIVEAMKMQNEMRSPKDGVVSKIKAVAGATVAQGEVLMTVE